MAMDVRPRFAARPAFSPWDRRELPGDFSVEESARRIGHYAWIEGRLFEAMGGWVATVPEIDVKIPFGRHCGQAAVTTDRTLRGDPWWQST